VKEFLGVLALGLAALVVQGLLARVLPLHLVPDLGLLVPLAAALVLEPAAALLLAAALGLGADGLSGALLGQHAFLRLLEVGIARGLAGQLDLKRAGPFAVFAAGVGIFDALGQAGLSRLFLGAFDFRWAELPAFGLRALATAACAPLVALMVGGLIERLREGQARREMRLDTRRPML
jgi:cell shape-determining protein MreD